MRTAPSTTPETKKDQGFTLIELLVVVVIIGILAAVAIPVFLSQREKATEAGIKSDLKNAATVQETYMVDNGTYANALADIEAPGYDFKSTDGNVIVVTGDADGYCITGAKSATDPVDFWYDSLLGGLAETNEAGGACV